MRVSFERPAISPEAETLRAQVRAFVATELAARTAAERAESWNGFDAGFSQRLGARGWIGMTLPTRYGGPARTMLERYLVTEELLAAGAPVAAHWIADRQSAALILRYGSEEQKLAILPRIARGECFFCIGMSEPDSGSDLASVRTRAVPTDGGYVVNGTKLWTSNAHRAHYMILLCRTSSDEQSRHAGLSQFLVDLRTPGIDIRPVTTLSGDHHFNEVVLNDVFLPQSALLGKAGDGWSQVTSELALERSGPERFLSSFPLLVELVRTLGAQASDEAAAAVGRLAAHLAALRRLSLSIAGMLNSGAEPSVQAALVKDLGALHEQEIPEIARLLLAIEPSRDNAGLIGALATTILSAPSFSLRGGTREILRGIVARELGLR